MNHWWMCVVCLVGVKFFLLLVLLIHLCYYDKGFCVVLCCVVCRSVRNLDWHVAKLKNVIVQLKRLNLENLNLPNLRWFKQTNKNK